jgi:thioredoxin reductase
MHEWVIIGAGLSGLSAALAAARLGVEDVLILEHRSQPGGFTSPYFASPLFDRERELVEEAKRLSYPVWTRATVVGLFPGEGGDAHSLFVQKENGTETVQAKRILIASGALEKPREAGEIPGSRPAGVITPHLAVELLERGEIPGYRVLIIGDTRMHDAAAQRLEAAGCRVERYRHRDVSIREIEGHGRVSGVKLHRISDGKTVRWSGDTVIYAKGRIPCTFFLKGTGVERDRHHAVVTDGEGRTNIPRIYAAGSCTVHGDDEHRSSPDLEQFTALFEKEV